MSLWKEKGPSRYITHSGRTLTGTSQPPQAVTEPETVLQRLSLHISHRDSTRCGTACQTAKELGFVKTSPSQDQAEALLGKPVCTVAYLTPGT